MINIKQIKKEFHQNSKELAWHFKQFYKTRNDDIEYFLCINAEYDYLDIEYQKELETLVFKYEEFFKLIHKCKRNLEKIEIFNVSENFTKKENDLYSEMANILKDIEFSKEFKKNLLKKKMFVNPNYKKDADNNLET